MATFPKVANEVLEAMSKRNSEEGGLKSGFFFPKHRFSVCFEKKKVERATVFFSFLEKTQNRGIRYENQKTRGSSRTSGNLTS